MKQYVNKLVGICLLILCMAAAAPVMAQTGFSVYATGDAADETADGWNADHTMYYRDGEAVTGIQSIGGKTYVFSAKGVLVQSKFCKIGDKRYFANKNGIMMANSWKTYNGKRYYLGEDGSAVQYRDKNAFVTNDARWVVTVKKIGDASYAFDRNAVMMTAGVYVDENDNFVVIPKANGKIQVTKTGLLNTAAKQNNPASKVITYLKNYGAKRGKTTSETVCIGGPDAKGYRIEYDHFYIYYYTDGDTAAKFINAAAK